MEIIKPGTSINFVGFRMIALAASVLVIAGCLAGIFGWPGPNWGIDFAGGAEIQVAFKKSIDMSKLREAMEDLDLGEVKVQEWLELGEEHSNKYLIRAENLTLSEEEALPASTEGPAEQPGPDDKDAETGAGDEPGAGTGQEDAEAVPGGEEKETDTGDEDARAIGGEQAGGTALGGESVEAGATTAGESAGEDAEPESMKTGTIVEDKLAQVFGKGSFEILKTDYVGPKVGKELRDRGILAIGYAIILILAYISLRFEFRFALGAVLALIHDVIITTGIFVWTHKEFNLAIIAALLTIVGYSLNDTIVVYDRIRENVRRLRRLTFREMINASINETLSRTILTSLTTLIVVFFLWLLGGGAIHDFAFALLIGVIVGTYSSIFVAGSFVIWWEDMRAQKRTPVVAEKK